MVIIVRKWTWQTKFKFWTRPFMFHCANALEKGMNLSLKNNLRAYHIYCLY